MNSLLAAVAAPAVSLLPEPVRRRLFARDDEVPERAASAILGLACFFGGFLFWCRGYLRFATAFVDAETDAVIRMQHPGMVMTILHYANALTFFEYAISITGLVAEYVIATGVLRLVALIATGEVPGEPLVTLVLFVVRTARGNARAAAVDRRRGPLRDDRSFVSETGEVVVVSCREKPDWNENVTIEAEGRLFRLLRVVERPDGEHTALHYVLAEQGPGHVVRGVVCYGRSVARDERP